MTLVVDGTLRAYVNAGVPNPTPTTPAQLAANRIAIGNIFGWLVMHELSHNLGLEDEYSYLASGGLIPGLPNPTVNYMSTANSTATTAPQLDAHRLALDNPDDSVPFSRMSVFAQWFNTINNYRRTTDQAGRAVQSTVLGPATDALPGADSTAGGEPPPRDAIVVPVQDAGETLIGTAAGSDTDVADVSAFTLTNQVELDDSALPTEPLRNGGFNQGADGLDGWVVSDPRLVTVSAANQVTLAESRKNAEVVLYQDFVIAAGNTRLTFTINGFTYDDEFLAGFTPDAFGVSLVHPSTLQPLVATAMDATDSYYIRDVVAGQAGAELVALDVSALSGQTVRLLFRFIGGSDGKQLGGSVTLSNVGFGDGSNTPPTADAGANQTVTEGDLVTLAGGFSDPDAGDAHTYKWQVLASNGQVVLDGAAQNFQFTPHDNGTYTIIFTVTDSQGEWDSDEVIVTVKNEAPTASIANNGPVKEASPAAVSLISPADPSTVDAGSLHYFLSLSQAERDAATYAGSGTATSQDFTFDDDGSYVVYGRILDKDGGFTDHESTVEVENEAPAVTAPDDQSASEGIGTTFHLGSFLDLGIHDRLWEVDVDWGDSTPHTTFSAAAQGALPDQTHTYADGLKTYLVTVRVKDKDEDVGTGTFDVTVSNLAPSVTSSLASQTRQYSDPVADVIFYATDVGPDLPGLTGEASWSWNGNPWEAGLPAGLTLTATGPADAPAWTLAGRPLSAPGSYVLKVAVTDRDGHTGAAETTLEVTTEDARATYIGDLFVSTSSSKSGKATVRLQATIQDITAVEPASDDAAGDIRNALVTFVNRDTGAIIKAGVPVVLTSTTDTTTGVATFDWAVDIGASNSESYTIGIIVHNYYTRNSSFDNAVVTVSRPLTTGFVTGGGYLVLTSPSGLKAGDKNTRANFGFNVKFNKNGTNLLGRANVIIRRLESDGLVHIYQIKGNSMSSLTVPPLPGNKATFTAKASIQDISNPLFPIAIDGNAILRFTLTDNGTPGTADTAGITVWDKHNRLWFSNHWDGTATVEQRLAGGNVVVHRSLQVEGGIAQRGEKATALTVEQAQPLVRQAVARWHDAGMDARSLASLKTIEIRVADLPGTDLGWASASGTIVIDQNAAGFGWFVDATPTTDDEFVGANTGVQDRVDLLTVLVHEMGHLLSLDHDDDPGTIMADTLQPGVRRMPGGEYLVSASSWGQLPSKLLQSLYAEAPALPQPWLNALTLDRRSSRDGDSRKDPWLASFDRVFAEDELDRLLTDCFAKMPAAPATTQPRIRLG